MQHEADVFISYSHRDRDWVRGELLPRLEAAGLAVRIDFRDFAAGAPSAGEMQRWVEVSRHTVLVLTVHYLESAWTELETLMLHDLDPANRERRLIPVLRGDCDLPRRLRPFTYVDLRPLADGDLGWGKLLRALGPGFATASGAVAPPTRGDWGLAHVYPTAPDFTGRVAERQLFSHWLEAEGEPLLLLRALGGFGKSAVVWHWLMHDVRPVQWPRVMWWSFYDAPAFESFLAAALDYLGEPEAARLPAHRGVEELVRALHRPGRLLVLDGCERLLRAYQRLDAGYLAEPGERDPTAPDLHAPAQRDCISLHAESFLQRLASLPHLRGRVLLTSRLLPRCLETPDGVLAGCLDYELGALSEHDAAAFLRARGVVRGLEHELIEVSAAYGHHPLSLRLLAGVILRDLGHPGDVAAARRLNLSGDLRQRRHHVLERAYDTLPADARLVLNTLACFRAAVDLTTLEAGLELPATELPAAVEELESCGLLHVDRPRARLDLHPIVRRYAYDRLVADDRVAIHLRLRDYFAALPPPERVERVEDLAPVVELFHQLVRAGEYEEAGRLYRDRLSDALYFQLGAYGLSIELLGAFFPAGEEQRPVLAAVPAQIYLLNELARVRGRVGQPRRAQVLLECSLALAETSLDGRNVAVLLCNLAEVRLAAGALRSAEAGLRRGGELLQASEDAFYRAMAWRDLGRLLAVRGRGAEAAEAVASSLALLVAPQHVQSRGVARSYQGLIGLLQLRALGAGAPAARELAASVAAVARDAMDLVDETAAHYHAVAPDHAHAHWLLGAALRHLGDLEGAEHHLTEALQCCRTLNLVELEADVLIDLARLRLVEADDETAASLARQALAIAERCDYVLQQADARLVLAALALAREDLALAREHAAAAERLARCDGPPEWTYKVAWDEAQELLRRIG